ncbi:uncharacterized protein N7482_001649 [Penicillium canariense]|uniref:Sulfatase N-terminal domain-containing protein n=1 Tax=Penicillium canariense TaxID=189055 RepID=A0A9W9LUD6_9EURO|nr:uncharacterized protein N7482_001649 [Penicillium canariense]KAJ5175772.1 hypothetical protein N7482_001649 [Penicillium canariense]
MAAKRPNFLVIVADDLGFSDTGPYGSEIETPNLDRLATGGLRMTDFHTASACSPTRAMLMSGTDNHIAGLGQMAEFMASNPGRFKGRPGYEGFLNFRVAALPEILQDTGYFTVMSGKWHLGMKAEMSPSARGFTRSAVLLPGAGNHYNYEPQLEPSVKRAPAFFNSDGLWMEDSRPLDRRTELPEQFYSSDYFTDRMLGFLKDHRSSETEQPFFAYLAYTAPHWPLQAPPEVTAKYRGVYDEGPESLRLKRLSRLQQLGLVPNDIVPAPMTAATAEWDAMTEDERKASARKMEVYAAMVDRMDWNIGRVLDHLENTGELDNTFVVFMSDNGAEGSLIEALPMIGSLNIMDVIGRFYDNSLDNIGNANSFVWYGPRWALAATAPSRGFKGWSTEGGIRCPCIVRYPGITRTNPISHDFCNVMDIAPTCLELAGVAHPGQSFRGREVVPFRGKSWVPFMRSHTQSIYDATLDVTGWELFGLRAIRRGDFKAVWLPEPRGKGEWELYNVTKDPGELEDLAATHTKELEDLMVEWEKYFAETGMIEISENGKGLNGI